MGGGIGMGNTCKPMAVLFQCMTKFTTNKKKKKETLKKKKIFQFVVIHIVKGFSVVNKAEVDFFFFNSVALSMTQWMLAI